jgi:hypothetical protein
VKMKATEGQGYQAAWVAVCASSYGVTNVWGCSGHTAETQAVVGKGREREKQKPLYMIYYISIWVMLLRQKCTYEIFQKSTQCKSSQFSGHMGRT